MLSQKVTGLAAAIDAAFFNGIPATTVALAIFQDYYKSTVMHREERIIELLVSLEEVKEELGAIVIDTESYQDSFVRMLREYTITSSNKKRKILASVFVGLLQAQQEYPIERMVAVTEQLTEQDVTVFSKVDPSKTRDLNYQVFDGHASSDQIGSIINLESLGLLRTPDTARLVSDGSGEPFVIITPFGRLYMDYLVKALR